jgi:large subunit ribosomal protein L35
MPKIRTNKIAKKRFKVTKTGKIVHRTKGARHLRSNKSKARQRRQDSPKTLTNTKFITAIKRLLGV